jgi:hypothetical protein
LYLIAGDLSSSVFAVVFNFMLQSIVKKQPDMEVLP